MMNNCLDQIHLIFCHFQLQVLLNHLSLQHNLNFYLKEVLTFKMMTFFYTKANFFIDGLIQPCSHFYEIFHFIKFKEYLIFLLFFCIHQILLSFMQEIIRALTHYHQNLCIFLIDKSIQYYYISLFANFLFVFKLMFRFFLLINFD